MNQLMKNQNRKAEVVRRMKSLTDRVDAEGRKGFTGDETAEFEKLHAECGELDFQIQKGLAEREREKGLSPVPDWNADTDQQIFDRTGEWPERTVRERHDLANRSPEYWTDKETGKRINMLSARDHWPNPKKGNGQRLHLGKMIRGIAVGKWDDAEQEQRLAMSTGTNIGGGYLINDQLSAEVLDLVRAKMVCGRAGARFIPMESDHLIMARQTADPTIAPKAENAAFTPSEVTFDAISATARTVGTYIPLSRELAEDAPNIADLIQNALVQALALYLDDAALNATGGSEAFEGLIIKSGVGSTGSIGAIAWEDVNAAALALRVLNAEPNAFVLSPTIENDLLMLTTGDGTNAAKGWLPAPPSLDGLARLSTTSCSDANIFVGDFRQMAFCLRHDARLEVSTEAGDAFAKHQMWIKVTWRGDIICLRASHFHRLEGITT